MAGTLTDAAGGIDRSLAAGRRKDAAIPAYIREVYDWAYLNPTYARILDRDAVVSTILLGNHARLRRALLDEIAVGQSVLQAAHVYGGLIPEIAARVGRSGRLDVIDLVPLQAALCRLKLRGYPQARVKIADAALPGTRRYDVVSCYFLLHEIPDEQKHKVVDALLGRMAPGGKVIFVDYHKPSEWHPFRGIMRRLFDRLEPFAASLWRHEISYFAGANEGLRWQKQTLFGGLYQKTVVCRA